MVVDPEIRFQRFVNRTDGCWLWTGVTGGTNARYGYFRITTSRFDAKVLAHRYAYELWVGPIPEGLEIDHKCRNTLCVNPAHLEPVTHKVNRQRSRLTVCRSGRHDLSDPANQRWDSQGNRRGCAACWREAAARRKGGQ